MEIKTFLAIAVGYAGLAAHPEQVGEPLVNPGALWDRLLRNRWNLPAAARILSSWDVGARLHAAFSLGLDYLFMLVYSCTLALSSLWAGR